MDTDALEAAVDLVGRTGVRELEVGYTDETVKDAADADWHATATYKGAKVIMEHHRGPVEAVEALARQLLTGGRCTHCHRRTRIDGDSQMDCRWTRHGKRWVRGCETTS